MKILGVNVLYVGRKSACGGCAVFVCAGEVADIEKNAEIRASDSRDDSFNPLALLTESAVIFNHRNDAL